MEGGICLLKVFLGKEVDRVVFKKLLDLLIKIIWFKCFFFKNINKVVRNFILV